jgi:2-polyprenyl-3-methyl-5-hydroxy-6-metoxy-1,4-benzoquinol methylase
MNEEGIAKVKELWGAQVGTWRVGRGIHWLEHEAVQQRINQKVVGETGPDRYQHFLRKYLAGRTPVERALTLGCGAGELERGLAQYDFCREHEAVDIAEGAIEKASELARVAGYTHIRYRVADLNVLRLSPQRYDVIFGISSVHHVAALENLYEQIASGLKPGGFFFLDEFVGPSQCQFTDAQLREVNEQIRVMPEHLKRSLTKQNEIKQPVVRPTIAEMNAGDPSEAIRSAEIVPLLSRYFDVLEVKGQGGSLLHLLLEDIAGNFNADTEGSVEYLNGLFDREDRLIAEGTLQDDFATIVARKK